jgi:signal transduction histidine kinase
MPTNRVPPEVVISKFMVDGRPVARTEPLFLPADTRHVEFQYAGLSYAAPEKVQYRYQLSNVDPGWREAGNQKEVTYAHLKSGSYRFQVTACNNDGVWQPGGAIVNFAIRPHFFESTWFYMVVAVGVAVSALGFDYWRMRRIRAQKKQLERMVQERTAELERQAVQRLELEARLHRARQLEVVGQLAAGMAHHFNNLLTIIQGNLSFLRDESGKTQDNESLFAIEKAALRAAGLVRQLLAFGQRHWLQRAEVDINELVQHHVGRVRPELPAGVELTVELAPALQKLFVDPEMIGQILEQLINNSRDALSGGGKIEVRTSRVELTASQSALIPESVPGIWVVLVVEDNGTGMTDEVRSHLREPFYTTKDVGRGTGLGLASVYGIVQQHHGWLDIRSTLGKGTEVRVYLPAGEPVPARS